MHKIMYIILLLISTLSFGQEINNEISKSENFKKLLNLYKIANQEKYNVDYYSIQIYNGNYKEADSLYKFSKGFFVSDSDDELFVLIPLRSDICQGAQRYR